MDPMETVDRRVLSKPPVFNSEDEKWQEWKFIFKSYIVLLSHAMYELMQQAEASEVPLAISTLSETAQAHGRTLYAVLAQLLRGRALKLLMTVPQNNGLEAWR